MEERSRHRPTACSGLQYGHPPSHTCHKQRVHADCVGRKQLAAKGRLAERARQQRLPAHKAARELVWAFSRCSESVGADATLRARLPPAHNATVQLKGIQSRCSKSDQGWPTERCQRGAHALNSTYTAVSCKQPRCCTLFRCMATQCLTSPACPSQPEGQKRAPT